VLAATVEQMQTIQHRYYVPNNSVLMLTGDVKADQVFAMADQLYANWPKAEDPFVKYPLNRPAPLPRSEVVVVLEPQVQTFTGEFQFLGPSVEGPSIPDTYPADLMGVATSEPSSRFQKDLVDTGACVGVGMNWSTQRNVGPITVDFEAAPDKIDACVAAVVAELPKLGQPGYFTPAELKNAAHTLDVLQVRDREKPSALANALTFWWATAGLDYYLTYVDHLNQVTEADLARYVSTYLTGKPFVFGAMINPAMAKAGIDVPHLSTLAGVAPAPKGASK
jgi:zinc protease